MGSKLTCATIDSANKRYATAASLDHVVAKQINPRRQDAAGAVGRRGQHRHQGGAVVLGDRAPRSPRSSTRRPSTTSSPACSARAPADDAARPPGRSSAGRAPSISCKADLQRYQSLKMSKADQDAGQDWLDLLRTTETGVMPTTPTSCSTDDRGGGAVQRHVRQRDGGEPDREDHARQRPRQHARRRRATRTSPRRSPWAATCS